MTLLEKAKSSNCSRRTKYEAYEYAELAVAYLRGEITQGQFLLAMERPTGNPHVLATSIARTSFSKGWVKIEMIPQGAAL